MASPRAGSPNCRTSATICFISASLTVRAPNFSPAAFVNACTSSGASRPEMRTARTPTLATSGFSC